MIADCDNTPHSPFDAEVGTKKSTRMSIDLIQNLDKKNRELRSERMASSRKPLPLKQRTSSVDGRRDYTAETWLSLVGLLKAREFVITVDHFSIWKRHLAWAIENGKDLREYMTQRYASSMIFMSLLLSTELSVLFNSAGVTTQVRQALMHEQHTTVSFWVGIIIIFSAILTLLSLISTFTAWTMVSAVSESNSHAIFRSSIGQYVMELPGRFIVGAIYSFMVWLVLFFFLLLPVGFWSNMLLFVALALFVHTITAFSAFGRIIMHTGAMGSKRIFETSFESNLLPHSLHSNLLTKARANLASKTSILRQYRSTMKPIDRTLSFDELTNRINHATLSERTYSPHGYHSHSTTCSRDSMQQQNHDGITPQRKRTASLVKFADGYDTSGERFEIDSMVTPRSSTVSPLSILSHSGDSRPQQHPPRPSLAPRGAKGPNNNNNNNKTSIEHSQGEDISNLKVNETKPTTLPGNRVDQLPATVNDQEEMAEKWLRSTILRSSLGDELHGIYLDSPLEARQHSTTNETLYNNNNNTDNTLDLPPLSSLVDFDDRHLTDDERFVRDYGDIFDAEHDYSISTSGGNDDYVDDDTNDEDDALSDQWTNGKEIGNNSGQEYNRVDSQNDNDGSFYITNKANNTIVPKRDDDVIQSGSEDERQGLLDRMERGSYNSIQD